MEGLVNVTESEVELQLSNILKTMPNVCDCEECRLDMATYALNRLKPHYVRTNSGTLIAHTQLATPQSRTEVLTVVMQGIQVVSVHPSHELPKERA